MTREDIKKRIEWLNGELWFEEMADLGYNFSRVRELEKEKAALEKMLEEMA